MPLYQLENIKGNVRDVGAGKQPPETMYETVNFVFDKELGSMKSRNGYTTGLTPPSDLTTLSYHLTKPVTYPVSEDTHLYFYDTSKIALKPFRHTSSSIATTASLGATGWVNVNEKKTFTVANAPTVTGSTTNTIALVSTDTCTALGLSTTANYYKNWVLVFLPHSASSGMAWLVKSYSVSADLATFTLDSVIRHDNGVQVTGGNLLGADELGLYRYYHKDKEETYSSLFTASYTDPDIYSTEVATRWSGGAGSTVGYKNNWTGYLNKVFFTADSTNKYTFTGTYCEQAECFAPSTTILKSLTQTNLAGVGLLASKNSTFDAGTLTGWGASGTHFINGLQSSIYPMDGVINDDVLGTIKQPKLQVTGLILNSNGAGDATSNCFTLSDTLSIVTATTYSLRIFCTGGLGGDILNWSIVGATGSNSGSFAVPVGINSPNELKTSFLTANTTESRTLKLWFSASTTANINLTEIQVVATASNRTMLPTSNTYRLYASYIYDGFQESDPTYLGGSFVNNALSYYVTVFALAIGNMNKRLTGIRLYLSAEPNDTTLQSNTTTFNPRYLIKEILVADSSVDSWALNVSTGKFELTVNIDGDLWNKKGLTWEQKTRRVASSSTTCSYSISNTITGRVFLAQYYDYGEARFYTNALRYASFNSDGVMCPDIFANIPDFFITYINVGSGNDIKSITEYNRTLICHKESSMCQLTTAEDQPLWQLRVIDNSSGCLNKWIPEILEDSLVWADANDIYAWSGGGVRSLTDRIWKQYWQTIGNGTASTYKTWVEPKDKTFNITFGSTAFFKVKGNGDFSTHTLANNNTTLVQTKSGSTYFATSAGVSYLFSTSATDSGTNFGCSFDTGQIAPEPYKMINIRKLFIHNTISGTLAGDLVIVVYFDGANPFTYTISAPSTVGGYLEVPLPANIKCHRFQVQFNNARDFKTNGAVAIHRIGVIYDVAPTDGDVSYKV